MRMDWTSLSEAVTTEVADRIGGLYVTPATTGDHAEIAATITGTNGTVFVKAARTDFGVRSLRFELRVGEVICNLSWEKRSHDDDESIRVPSTGTLTMNTPL